MVLILSPILIGLLVIASLLPFLERFKLPGVEADVRPPPDDLESPPPHVDVSLGELAAESLALEPIVPRYLRHRRHPETCGAIHQRSSPSQPWCMNQYHSPVRKLWNTSSRPARQVSSI